MKRLIARFIKDERGATAIEYGLIAGLIALAIAVSAGTLGTNLGLSFKALADKVAELLPKT
ncbi:Flp family type IVb pilin [Cupriavidus nantongensis]|uniref:Flp family type IVb pilin n=1 Tax=Cupriavidus nantongensis TaxID=1796606 RepID=UPI00224859AA|nr:Flp family type IVb pilin [Cupriavidus nantongensis]